MELGTGLGLIGEGVEQRMGNGNEWMAGTDLCVSIWCVLREDGMKPPSAFVTDVLSGTATEF